MKRLTTEEFITRAKLVHGDTYRYDNTVYSRAKEPITITCKVHGDFTQIADTHLSGSGCKKCADVSNGMARRSSTSVFLDKANKVHGNTYDYVGLVYITDQVKVPITCRVHGIFYQTPLNHLQGQGCPICARVSNSINYRFMDDVDTILYVLYIPAHDVYKIGVTRRTISARYQREDIEYSVVLSVVVPGNIAYLIEYYVLQNLYVHLANKEVFKYGGNSEVLLINPLEVINANLQIFYNGESIKFYNQGLKCLN